MSWRILLLLLLVSTFSLGFTGAAKCGELSFGEVWKIVSAESKTLQASHIELEAATEAVDRAERHWLPRVYLDAKGYRTNDPGAAFFGALSQRSVTAADFNPGTLNQPEAQWFSRGALGVDLPLYEGGARSAQILRQGHLSAGIRDHAQQAKVSQYSEVARAYGSLNSLAGQQEKLERLQVILDRLMKSYQLGSKSNPVGYSGLLGLRTLSNRIRGLLAECKSRNQANRAELAEMGIRQESWVPASADLVEFLNKVFPQDREGESATVMAQREIAMAAQSQSDLEKSRYLPRVGVFAEEYLFGGNRKTDSGYSAGLYLQWNLFSPGDFGVAKEARLNAGAAELNAAASAEQERIAARGIREGQQAALENLKLMKESEGFLEEQTKVSESLFRNGSINALQLVEVLSRRADLIAAEADTQLALLKFEADRAGKLNFAIPSGFEGSIK